MLLESSSVKSVLTCCMVCVGIDVVLSSSPNTGCVQRSPGVEALFLSGWDRQGEV